MALSGLDSDSKTSIPGLKFEKAQRSFTVMSSKAVHMIRNNREILNCMDLIWIDKGKPYCD